MPELTNPTVSGPASPAEGDLLIRRLAAANEQERLAAELDRRGGGFTARAAALARQRAEREREAIRQEFVDLLSG